MHRGLGDFCFFFCADDDGRKAIAFQTVGKSDKA